MLQSLRVTNFALIEELEVEFGNGLNILTGETGAGKSILLGSIQAALGAKTSKELIRSGAESAYVELYFDSCTEPVKEELLKQEISVEDGITISRKMTAAGKSVHRINGENVSAAVVKTIASLLLEIHGQQEHHRLLNREMHLELVDRFGGEKLAEKKEKTAAKYLEYSQKKAELLQAEEDASNKNRDIAFLEFACREIEEADYQKGEEETLEKEFQKLSHAKAIKEGVEASIYAMSKGTENADDCVSSAVKALSKIASYDETAANLLSRAEELAALISDFSHEADNYLDSLSGFEEDYATVSERLNVFHHLKSKYGKTMEAVVAYGCEMQEKLDKYSDYDAYLERLRKEYSESEKELIALCEELSVLRAKASDELAKRIVRALSELNFLEVRFEIRMEKTEFHRNGNDVAEFYIATNPGEELRPIIKVASGGELSRIMLALKSVFAERDEIPTMIFDEIDTGISGRTAQMVSEKMAEIASTKQLLCITHLPQIAAMADHHYYIEKTTDGRKTVTGLKALEDGESVKELARMLGGADLTEAVYENAREMKQLAQNSKKR